MLVEFDSVRGSLKEGYEKDVLREKAIGDVPFENVDDYKTKITIEMDRIVDFTGGTVWLNDIQYECVYAYDHENDQTPNLLISYDDFKKVFENVKGIKIFRHEEL